MIRTPPQQFGRGLEVQTTLQTSQQCTERLGGFKCASALDCSCPSLPRVLKHEVAAPCVLPDGHTTTGDLCGIGGIQPARAVPNQPSRHLRPCSLVSSALFSLSRGTGAEGEQELAAESALLGLPRARSQAAGEGKTRLCFGGWRLRTAADTREAGIRLSAPKPSAAGAEIKREHGGNPMVLFPFGSYEANLVHPGSA